MLVERKADRKKGRGGRKKEEKILICSSIYISKSIKVARSSIK